MDALLNEKFWEVATMFAELPCHIRVQVVALLAKNEFRAAKAIYDVWMKQTKNHKSIPRVVVV